MIKRTIWMHTKVGDAILYRLTENLNRHFSDARTYWDRIHKKGSDQITNLPPKPLDTSNNIVIARLRLEDDVYAKFKENISNAYMS